MIIVVCAGRAQEIPEGEFFRRMDLGEDLMNQGDYEAAQDEFLYILKNKEVLPTNLAYLFGRNSYHLNQFKQSINWLNKYLQIKGTKGQYHNDAVKYLHMAEEKYLAIQRSKNKSAISNLNANSYDCGGLDKMICPVCKGNGVIVTQGPFGNTYKTCPYSAGESFLSCDEYNDFMSGIMEPKLSN